MKKPMIGILIYFNKTRCYFRVRDANFQDADSAPLRGTTLLLSPPGNKNEDCSPTNYKIPSAPAPMLPTPAELESGLL